MFKHRGFRTAFILTMFAAACQMAADNAEPWAQTDLMPAAELNRQLLAVKAGKIILLQVGFRCSISRDIFQGPSMRALE